MRRGTAILFRLTAVVAVAGLVCSAAVPADALAEYRAAKQKALAPRQADYERVVAAHKDDPAVQRYREQLELIDGLVAQVAMGLDACRLSAITSFLDGVMDDDGTRPPGVPLQSLRGRPIPDPLRIIAEYGRELDVPSAQGLYAADQECLRQCLRAALRSAAGSTAGSARVGAVGTTEEQIRYAHLCAVTPLLAIAYDPEPWLAYPGSMADLLPRLDLAEVAEELALKAHRPAAACMVRSRAKGGGMTPCDRTGYLAWIIHARRA